MADFQIPQDRLLPLLTATLSDADGALNLTAAEGIRFQMRAPGSSTLLVDSAADVVDALTGEVRYTWLSGDTADPGLYIAWFEVETSGKTFAAPEPSLVIEVTRGAG